MTSCEPLPGDVWLAYLRFADHPDVGKVRPVVVVDVSGTEVLVLKVTSKSPRPESGDVRVTDIACAGLRLPSVIWLSPAFVLEKGELLRDAPIGRLSRGDMAVVDEGLSCIEQARLRIPPT